MAWKIFLLLEYAHTKKQRINGHQVKKRLGEQQPLRKKQVIIAGYQREKLHTLLDKQWSLVDLQQQMRCEQLEKNREVEFTFTDKANLYE